MIKKISPQELAMRITREFLDHTNESKYGDMYSYLFRCTSFARYAIEEYKGINRLSRAKEGRRDYVTSEEMASLLSLLGAVVLSKEWFPVSEDPCSEAGAVLVQAKLESFFKERNK